jgi:tetratricopeptide (TPR) repeat protein
LYAEAIEQLEDLCTTMKETAVARTLGDIYAVIGLNREAEKRYIEALSLTPATDLEDLGLTQKSLAQVYETLGLFDRAMAQLAEAKKAYRRLGNRAMVNSLSKAEHRLKQPRNRT